MSPSLYGFVKGREPVSPGDLIAELLRIPNSNGDARSLVDRLVVADPRFVWDEQGCLRTVDQATLSPGDAPYVVFDVETTGSSARYGGITELGAVKVVRGEVVDEFSTLVNPRRPIEPFVVRLTGITDAMVAVAPDIDRVMPRFEEFVEGAVLVGHNVQFDCSFVTAARGGVELPNPVLDTLKLARTLVPGLRRYKLSALAGYFGIRQVPNHRALSDAAATAGVFVELLKMLQNAGVRSVAETAALRPGGRPPVVPRKLHLADGIPNSPGVYYFLDGNGVPLYVGKAKNLRSRVRTYFNGGDGRRKIDRLLEEVEGVSVRETTCELQALVLEAREIKRFLPRYNSTGRQTDSGWFLKLDTDQPYPVPERIPAAEPTDGGTYLGPYWSAGVLDTCIEALGRIFPLRRCSSGGGGRCFYGQMNRCAPCLGMDEEEYRLKVVGGISALLRGEGGEEHLAALVKERERLAGELEFEAAARLRDLIAGIERIRLTKATVNAEGLRAAVAPSTEPGVAEVFVLSSGRLVAHEGFETGDSESLKRFAGELLAQRELPLAGQDGSDEARIVAAYLRRRAATVEAVCLEEVEDLLAAVRRVAAVGDEVNVALLT